MKLIFTSVGGSSEPWLKSPLASGRGRSFSTSSQNTRADSTIENDPIMADSSVENDSIMTSMKSHSVMILCAFSPSHLLMAFGTKSWY